MQTGIERLGQHTHMLRQALLEYGRSRVCGMQHELVGAQSGIAQGVCSAKPMQCLVILLLQNFQARPHVSQVSLEGLPVPGLALGELQEGHLVQHCCGHHTQYKMSNCPGIGR